MSAPDRPALPGHAAFARAFDAGLKGAALPPGITARDPAETERRFAVYRNNVATSLSAALARRFPVIERLVGEAFFAAMARVYAESHRPASPVLLEWGESFPGFLADFPPLADHPYMADVARIEWARGLAFHAADADPLDPARLAGVDPGGLRLGLHPSLRLLRLSFPAVSIWARNQPGAVADAPLSWAPECALILRDRAFGVPVRALGAGDAALVEQIGAGATLMAAAEAAQWLQPGHDPGVLILWLMQAGAFVPSPRTDPQPLKEMLPCSI